MILTWISCCSWWRCCITTGKINFTIAVEVWASSFNDWITHNLWLIGYESHNMTHIQRLNSTSARKFHFRHNLQLDWNSLFLQLSNMDISFELDLLWNTKNKVMSTVHLWRNRPMTVHFGPTYLNSVWESGLHDIPILVAIRWAAISNFNTTAFICQWWRHHC